VTNGADLGSRLVVGIGNGGFDLPGVTVSNLYLFTSKAAMTQILFN
jgi:hypothetical protein